MALAGQPLPMSSLSRHYSAYPSYPTTSPPSSCGWLARDPKPRPRSLKSAQQPAQKTKQLHMEEGKLPSSESHAVVTGPEPTPEANARLLAQNASRARHL